MKKTMTSAAAFAALAVAILAHGSAAALTATDLSTLTSRSYRKGGNSSIRIYKDLAYSTRDDLANEGSGFVYVNGETNGTHRSGTYYDAYVKGSLFTSSDERSKMPVFVFLHGGAWCQPYDKDVACQGLLECIANKGYFVISMSYQLQEDVINDSSKTARANATFGHMLKDVDTMLAYLKVELPKLGMPTNMVAIGGESAGGHLALCYAFDQTAPRLTGMGDVGLSALSHPLPVSCVMSDVGPTDLTECSVIDQSWGIGAWVFPKLKGMKLLMGWLCGKDFSNMSKQDAAVYIKKWNPTSLISSSSCPAILAYGCTSAEPTANSDDTMVAVSNFIGLTNALKRAGVSYKAKLYTNTGHGSVASVAQDWIANKLYDFKTNHFVVAATPVVQEPVAEEPASSYGELYTAAFSKKVDVVFDGYSGTSSLADFPVLVRLSENIPGFSYADFKKTGGGDLRFASSSGKLLPHEIDTWNPNGVSTVWVKVPTLTASTAIVACYGCANPPAVNPKDVWSNGYVGVWHLGESAIPMKESSGESVDFNEAKGSNLGYAQAGVVGGSVDFNGLNGGTGGLRAPDCDSLDGFTACTFEMWTWQKRHDAAKQRFLLAKRVSYNSDISYNIYDSFDKDYTTNKVACGIASDQGTGTSSDVWASLPASATPELGSWNMVAHVYDSAAGRVMAYLNGMNKTNARFAKGVVRAGAGKLVLGNQALASDYAFPGKIDEVRISNVARSADWIKATHDTVMNPGFATYSTSAGKLAGYAAWMNVKELVGKPGATTAKGIVNAVRYAFDIDPAKGADEIGEPILKIVRDADGKPAVRLRNLAEGRSDVAVSVLASEDLNDWSKATVVSPEEFSADGLWKPASNRKSGAVPSQMFFRYTVDVR